MQHRPVPAAPDVARALGRVLRRPELAPERTDGLLYRIATWYAHAKAAFWELVRSFHVLERGSPILYRILLGWLVVSAVAILAHLIYTFAQNWRVRDRAAGAARQLAPGRMLTSEDWEARARRAAAEGRFRDAAVAQYQALLLRLHASGLLRFDPAKTPGEYRREVRANPAAPAFARFLRTFEPVAFGGRALDSAGYDALRATAAEVARSG